MKLYLRGKSYWVRFTHGGEQHRLPTGEKVKTKAQSVAVDIIKKVEQGDDPRQVLTPPPILREFAQVEFRNWVETSRHLKPASKDSYLYGLSLLVNQPLYKKRMDLITRLDAQGLTIPGSNSTFNIAISALRKMFHLAVEMKKIDKAPKFAKLKETVRTEVITAADERNISSILASKRIGRNHGSIRQAFPLSEEMGMLPNEIANLRIAEVDFEVGKITSGKSGRVFTMTAAARAALIRQCRGKTEWVFPSCNLPGKPIKRQAVTKALARIKKGQPTSLALRVAFPIYMDTGLRRSELAALRIEHIDLVAGTLSVVSSKSEAGERVIPLAARIKPILFEHIADRKEGWLFPSPRKPGLHITPQALTKSFAGVRDLAGISKAKKLHTTRHTFGTDIMGASGNPKLVMNLMGHTSLKVTMRYLHPETTKVAGMLDKRNQERQEEIDPSKPVN